MKKHFIDIENFSLENLRDILNKALHIKSNPDNYKNSISQKSIGMLFEKQSLRTRVSFQVAIQNMGGNFIEIEPTSIGLGSRESESDIIQTLSQYIDLLVIRNDDHNKIKEYANYNYLSIINGLSNYSHPCQILSDIFTIEEALGKIDNLLIVWCGDINNVCVSLLQAAKLFSFKLHISAPNEIINENQNILNKYKTDKIEIIVDPYSAVSNANCIMTDKWISMNQKNSNEKKELLKNYQINEKLIKNASENCIFMHCLPASRNKEVTNDIIDGKKSLVWEQAKNRMFVQQSILTFILD